MLVTLNPTSRQYSALVRSTQTAGAVRQSVQSRLNCPAGPPTDCEAQFDYGLQDILLGRALLAWLFRRKYNIARWRLQLGCFGVTIRHRAIGGSGLSRPPSEQSYTAAQMGSRRTVP